MAYKLKFLLLSLIGIIFFLVPIPLGGESKIMISHITDFIMNNFIDGFLMFTALCAWIVLIATIVFIFYTSSSRLLNDIFKSTPIDTGLRLLGSFFYLMTYYNWFSQSALGGLITHPDTGGVMAGEGGLLTTLYITFFVGIIALPLLTDFGLVDFLGVLLGPIMYKVFKVPGSSTVDALTSFVGDGTIGIVLTDRQYQGGYYTKRQAYIIASSFSVVGIAFSAAVAEELGFGSIFPLFYGTILLVCLIIAFVQARMPMRKFENEYHPEAEPKTVEKEEDVSIFKTAMDSASEQAEINSIKGAFGSSLKHVIDIYVGFIPIIMAVGTLSLVIAEFTPLLDIISFPFVYLYEFLGFSGEAAEVMAPASLAGFADMYLPAIFVSGVSSAAARFFIGVLAFTQLVFLSETGMILTKTEIGLNFWDVAKLFLFRTVLSIPILIVIVYGLSAVGVL